jgi:hypothetical protein
MQVIAVAAQFANGKDVLFDYLALLLNKNFSETDPNRWHRTAFANSVKEVFESSFGVDRNFTEIWKRNPEPPSGMLKPVRQALQFIGDGFRQIKSDIWIDIVLRDESKKLLVSDSRYINEAKAVKDKGGIMFVLYRPGFLNNDSSLSESQIGEIVRWCKDNLEEGPIPKYEVLRSKFDNLPEGIQYYDFFLKNDGELADLYDKVDRIVLPFIQEKCEIERQ